VITRVKLAIKEKRQEKGEEKKDAWKGVESEIALRKRRGGKEQRRRGVGDRNKTVYFVFFGITVLCLKKNVIRNRKALRAKLLCYQN
jgi:hypothetical protein